MKYESNPKHKEPWQPGEKGTMCPKDKSLCPSKMLKDSIPHGKKRYAVYNGVAYAAQRHRVSGDEEFWHGYPEAWVYVPEGIRRQWLADNKVKRRMLRKFWKRENLGDL